MWFSSWFDAPPVRPQSKRSHARPRRDDRRRRQTRRPVMEGLEDRRLLTFVPAVDYSTGASPQAVVAADFNNDTILDLATANYSDRTVSVFLGNADGTFQPAVDSPTATVAGFSRTSRPSAWAFPRCRPGA